MPQLATCIVHVWSVWWHPKHSSNHHRLHRCMRGDAAVRPAHPPPIQVRAVIITGTSVARSTEAAAIAERLGGAVFSTARASAAAQEPGIPPRHDPSRSDQIISDPIRSDPILSEVI